MVALDIVVFWNSLYILYTLLSIHFSEQAENVFSLIWKYFKTWEGSIVILPGFFSSFFSLLLTLKKETQMLEVVKMKKQEEGCMFFRYFYNLASWWLTDFSP